MAGYIEREAGLTELCRGCSLHSTGDNVFCGIACPKYERIAAIPAADVRPVVLCRDCTHCRKGKTSLECEKHTYAWNNMRRWVDEDDFCSWGVKREEADG